MGSSGEKRKPTPTKSAKDRTGSKEQRRGDVGRALQTVYQETVEEAVPAEMIDLLRKLG